MSDQSKRNAKVVALFGTALLSTIDILIQEDLFKEGSSVRNIGLILSLFIGFAEDCCGDLCEKGENDWKKRVVLTAQDHGVEIKGPFGIEEQLQSIRTEIADETDDGEDEWEDIDDSDDEDGHRKWGKWDWKKEVNLRLIVLAILLNFSDILSTCISLPIPENTPAARLEQSVVNTMISQRCRSRSRRNTKWVGDEEGTEPPSVTVLSRDVLSRDSNNDNEFLFCPVLYPRVL